MSNPFGDSDEVGDEEKSICSKVSTLNPFGEDEMLDEIQEGKEEEDESRQTDKGKSSNPFDEDESIDSETVFKKSSIPRKSLVLFPAKAEAPPRPISTPRSELSSEVIQDLREKGLNIEAFKKLYSEHNLNAAAAKDALIAQVMLACQQPQPSFLARLWQPPITVRVSTWLPNIEDKESKSFHTGYFSTVRFSFESSGSWQVSQEKGIRWTYESTVSVIFCFRLQVIARYAKYYNLWCSLYTKLEQSFPQGMMHPFPDDRWKSKLFGVTGQYRYHTIILVCYHGTSHL
jgi:hypothetical protein